MNPNRRVDPAFFKRVAPLTLLLAATTPPSWAQSGPADKTQRVEVTAPSVGVRTVCPDVEAEMLQALARVAMQHRQEGLLDVSFVIDGRAVGNVAVAGGPHDYHRATRHAVSSLACDNGNAGLRTVRLQLVFRDL
jgi:hypothetical protein